MGANCSNPSSFLQNKSSRFHEYTEFSLSSGFCAGEVLQLEGLQLSLYLSHQNSYIGNWSELEHALLIHIDNPIADPVKRLVWCGIPDIYMKDYLHFIFQYPKSYYSENLAQTFPVFSNQLGPPSDFKQTPTFSEHTTIESGSTKPYLNPSGKSALSRIMWTLNTSHSLFYCPQVLNVASLLIIYLSEEETYQTLVMMLEKSSNCEELSKYFITSQSQLQSLTGAVVKVLRKESKALLEHFYSKGRSIAQSVADMIEAFGVGYFPLCLLSRILQVFILNGQEALCQVIIVMLSEFSDLIIAHNGDPHQYLRLVFYPLASPNRILAKSSKVALKHSDFPVSLRYKSPITFYRPRIESKFSIIKEYHIEVLWTYLSQINKFYKPVTAYSSQHHGFSLKTLLRATQKFQPRTPMIILVKSETHIFGGFLDCALHKNIEFIGGPESFVFSLEPSIEVFNTSGKNSLYSLVGETFIAFGGGGEGPAFCISEDMIIAQSYKCATYANKIFSNGYANILGCEVIALIN